MTGMLNLPAELLVNVAKEVDIAFLRNFRLVCRDLRAAAEDRFVHSFFTNRHHILTKFSLITLLAITKDPHFRPKIKSVHFYLPSTDHRANWQYDSSQELDNPEWIERLRSRLQEERSAFEEKNAGEKMLGEVMSQLAEEGECEHVGLSYATHHTPYAFGLQTLEKSLGYGCREGRYGEECFDNTYVQRLFLSAIVEARMSPLSLTVISPCTGPGTYDLEMISRLDATDSFDRLEKLEIGLDTVWWALSSTGVCFRYIGSILHASTETLTELTIHLESRQWVAHELNGRVLSKLTIYSDRESEERDIINILRDLRQSLRHLSLHEDDYAVFKQFDFLSKKLQLDVFEYHRSRWRPGRKYEGKEAIAAGVLELMKDGDEDEDGDEDSEVIESGDDDGEAGDDGDQDDEVEGGDDDGEGLDNDGENGDDGDQARGRAG